jgi:hypothetical protein
MQPQPQPQQPQQPQQPPQQPAVDTSLLAARAALEREGAAATVGLRLFASAAPAAPAAPAAAPAATASASEAVEEEIGVDAQGGADSGDDILL